MAPAAETHSPHRFSPVHPSTKMPGTTNCEKTQPWRAHWPPLPKATEGVEYGVEKGQVVVVDGTSAKQSVAKKNDATSAADKKP